MDVLQFLQLVPEDGRVLATPAAVIAGLTYNFLPFMILPIYASLERIDTSLIEAGKDLYASATQTFLRVTLPITAPGIVAGVLLTFIPAVGDYINAEILGGTGNSMIGNVIQSLYLEERLYPEAAALSFVMMAAILGVVLIYLRFAGSGRSWATRTRGRPEWRTATHSPDRAAGARRRASLGLAAPKRADDLRRVGGRLHADPDRRDRAVLVRHRPTRASSTSPSTASPSSTGRTPSPTRTSTTR